MSFRSSSLRLLNAFIPLILSSSLNRLRTPPLSTQRLLSIGASKKTPTDFGKGFLIRRPDEVFMLEQLNHHSMDDRISFEESSHTYLFDGRKMKYSVTQLIDQYFEKFDTDLVITRMMKGSNWPRPEYIHPVTNEPFTREEIKEKWDQGGEQARNQGTWMHYNIERFFNQLDIGDTVPEFSQFYDFLKNVIQKREILPIRTEWKIVAADFGLAGSVDFIGRKANGAYVMIDWKRSKDLENNLRSNFGKMAKPPIQHIDDCTGSKYALQLNTYRYILRHYYGIDVSEMIIASFHPNLSKYFAIEVPIMDFEVSMIINDLRSR